MQAVHLGLVSGTQSSYCVFVMEVTEAQGETTKHRVRCSGLQRRWGGGGKGGLILRSPPSICSPRDLSPPHPVVLCWRTAVWFISLGATAPCSPCACPISTRRPAQCILATAIPGCEFRDSNSCLGMLSRGCV